MSQTSHRSAGLSNKPLTPEEKEDLRQVALAVRAYEQKLREGK